MSKPLHPRVHLIVGLLITGVSAYSLMFTEVASTQAMELFLFIGLGFIALAFIKIAIKYVKSGQLRRDEEKVASKIGGVKGLEKKAQYQEQARRQAQQGNKPQLVYCQLCGTRNYITSNYCHMCGYKLK